MAGTYDQPKILGWDAAGIVEKVGPEVTFFKPGDEVYYAGDLTRQGCNSEFHAVDERIVGTKPKSLSFEQAAALPLTAITAWESLFDRVNLHQNPSDGAILIIGGAGGVGSIATQLAKTLTRKQVIATASRAESRAWCKKMGADFVVNHNQDLSTEIQDLKAGPIQAVFAFSNTDRHLAAIEKVIEPQGKVCLIDDPASFDIMPFKRKCISIHWEFMFARSMFNTPDMVEQHRLLERVALLCNEGKIQSTVNVQFQGLNAENLKKAHALLESGHTTGKIVITI
jgi:NADPH2:quinone reductase